MPDIPASAIRDAVDEDVRVALKPLLMATIAEARRVLTHGTPQAKEAILKTLLPTAARVVGEDFEDERVKKLREEWEAIRAEMRGE